MELSHTCLVNTSGSPWIVMIHGFGGSQLTWNKQIDAFRTTFNLLLFDLPGHGDSKEGISGQGQGFDMQDIAREAITLLHGYGIKKAHFLCVSLGTLVLSNILELCPELVDSVVLCGAIFGMGPLAKIALQAGNLCKHFLPYMVVVNMLATILMPRHSHRISRKYLIQECGKLGHSEFIKWYTLLTRELYALRNRAELLTNIPSLVVMGREDYIFLGQAVGALKKIRGSVGLHIIENCGHVCSLQSWREFNRISLGFLCADTSLQLLPEQPIHLHTMA